MLYLHHMKICILQDLFYILLNPRQKVVARFCFLLKMLNERAFCVKHQLEVKLLFKKNGYIKLKVTILMS